MLGAPSLLVRPVAILLGVVGGVTALSIAATGIGALGEATPAPAASKPKQ